MTYENPKELFKSLEIDIVAKDRRVHTQVLKMMYVNEYFKEHKPDAHTRKRLAHELNIKKCGLYNIVKSYENIKNNKDYAKLFLSFKNKDKALISEYIQEVKEKRKLNSKINTYIGKEVVRKVIIKKEKVEYPEKPLMSNENLCKLLRENKQLNHPAWKIPVNNISVNQWEQIKNINPKMFELMKI